MPPTLPKNGARSLVVERALEEGVRKASASPLEDEVTVHLEAQQERMLGELCTAFGLSTRSVLNAALRYALREASERGQALHRIREYPRKTGSLAVRFELTAETRSLVREADAAEHVAGGTVAGLKLLHGRTLKAAPKRKSS